MERSRIMRFVSVAAFIGSALMSLAVPAQERVVDRAASTTLDKLEEVVVTARRREEGSQSVPIAVSALSGDALERSSIGQLDEIGHVVPSLNFTPQQLVISGNVAYIRGVGSQEPALSLDAPVAIYLDGVYVGRNQAANLELVDIARVEVLRGPQGTLFGRNATGGAIAITSKSPSTDFGLEQKFGYGSFDDFMSRTKLDTGEWATSGLSATISYLHHNRDGYVDNPSAASDRDPGSVSNDAVWARLHGKWGGVSADYTFDANDMRGAPAAYQISNVAQNVANYYAASPLLGGGTLQVSNRRLGRVDLAVLPRQRVEIYGHALTLEAQLSNLVTLKSISAYRDYEGHIQASYGPSGLLGIVGMAVAPVTPYQSFVKDERQHQTSQELQVFGDIERLSYIGGLYYFKEKAVAYSPARFTFVNSTGTSAFNLTSLSAYESVADSYAGFGQVTYRPEALSDRIELTAGLRYTKDEKSVDQVGPTVRSSTREFHNVSFDFTSSFKPRPGTLVYGKISSGYRSGGFNIRAGAGMPFAFSPEELTAYEIGVKTDLLDDRFRLNAAAYYYDYKDLQIPQTTASSSGGSGFTNNTDAKMKGFEFEFSAIPFDGFFLDGALGYVDPEYKAIFFPAPGTGVSTNYANIAHFPYVSEWTARLGTQFTRSVFGGSNLTARLDYSWISRRWFNPTDLPNLNPFNDEIASPSHGLLSASLTLEAIELRSTGVSMDVRISGENLLDKSYRVAGIDFGSLGFAGNVWGMPRRLGIDVKFRY